MADKGEMLTKTAATSEVKENFGEYVREVERGEPVVITRYGRPVAVLVSPERYAALERNAAPSAARGLLGLAGRWDDGDELADEVERVVRSRAGVRSSPTFDDPL